jgi:hypothetical protein
MKASWCLKFRDGGKMKQCGLVARWGFRAVAGELNYLIVQYLKLPNRKRSGAISANPLQPRRGSMAE